MESIDEFLDTENILGKHIRSEEADKVVEEEMPTNSSAPQVGSKSARIRGTGKYPLKRFAIMIGCKKLRFRIVSKSELKESENNASNSRSQKLFCSKCGQTFASNLEFQRHTSTMCRSIIESGTRMNLDYVRHYKCHDCQKTFNRASNYKIHMKLHESGQRFFCSICGKWFRDAETLRQHSEECEEENDGAETSSKERLLRFKCNYCEKMFHYRRDRIVHERSHTGERPYTCGYCGRGFTQSQALTSHIRTHTGEKPYVCEYCGGTFRDVSALRKHEVVKHMNELQNGPSVALEPATEMEPPPTNKNENSEANEILSPEEFDSMPIIHAEEFETTAK